MSQYEYPVENPVERVRSRSLFEKLIGSFLHRKVDAFLKAIGLARKHDR